MHKLSQKKYDYLSYDKPVQILFNEVKILESNILKIKKTIEKNRKKQFRKFYWMKFNIIFFIYRFLQHN